MRSKINLVFLKTNGLNHGLEIPLIFIHLLTKSNTFINSVVQDFLGIFEGVFSYFSIGF